VNRILLDTHVLVWLLEGNARLGQNARNIIQSAADADTLQLSAITPWEIAMLVAGHLKVLDASR
jgi:PIN domain nuclease of toxin-antitoxin system